MFVFITKFCINSMFGFFFWIEKCLFWKVRLCVWKSAYPANALTAVINNSAIIFDYNFDVQNFKSSLFIALDNHFIFFHTHWMIFVASVNTLYESEKMSHRRTIGKNALFFFQKNFGKIWFPIPVTDLYFRAQHSRFYMHLCFFY